jgi:hypothetical protein
MLTEIEVDAIKPVRYARKVWDGGGLYLLMRESWRFCDFQGNTTALIPHEPGPTDTSGSTAFGRQRVIAGSGRSPAPGPGYFTGAIRC